MHGEFQVELIHSGFPTTSNRRAKSLAYNFLLFLNFPLTYRGSNFLIRSGFPSAQQSCDPRMVSFNWSFDTDAQYAHACFAHLPRAPLGNSNVERPLSQSATGWFGSVPAIHVRNNLIS